MYELQALTAQSYYIDCPAKMGVYLLDEKHALLIDSGNDKNTGRKVQKIFEEQGWTLSAILNTHAHADHVGGNALLQERLGVPAYSPSCEAAFANHPMLEAALLYGGYAPKPLRNKFFWPEKSRVQPLEAFPAPEGMRFLPLPGHFFAMTGVQTPDGVWFLADSLSSEEVLAKYHISFLYDIAAQFETLALLETLPGDCFVLSHAAVTNDLRPLVNANRKKMEEILSLLRELLAVPKTPEELLQAVFAHYELRMDFAQYALVGSTIRSYVAYLSDLGEVSADFSDNLLHWSLCPKSVAN